MKFHKDGEWRDGFMHIDDRKLQISIDTKVKSKKKHCGFVMVELGEQAVAIHVSRNNLRTLANAILKVLDR